MTVIKVHFIRCNIFITSVRRLLKIWESSAVYSDKRLRSSFTCILINVYLTSDKKHLRRIADEQALLKIHLAYVNADIK